jgi:hypothetical protein
VNIIQAMDHPKLFAPFFQGSSWTAWRVFLASLFAVPMDDDAMATYRRHTGREAAPTAPFVEAELVVGRRGGKSRILALILIATYLACFKDYSPYLAPGEVATVAVLAADRKQARTIFRYIIGLMREVPALAAMIEDDGADAIKLNNRVVIEISTASFRVTRGYTFAAVLADETAFWRDENSANPDVEIFRALRPGMASIPGAILINASSPYRRAGLLWQIFQRYYGRADGRVLVWKASTSEMNPRVDQVVIAEAFEEDPESAASEYGGEFRTDIADFVSRQIVEACIELGCHERPPVRAGGRYHAFVDAAGGSGSDSMTLAISHLEGAGSDRIPTLDAVRERKPPFSPDDVVAEFSALMKSYHVSRATSDKWGADWIGEAFRKYNIMVEPHAEPKSDIHRELLPLLNGRRCSLLDHPRLVAQLCGLERRVSRGGKDSIDHAPSPAAHDDVANAVAGALLLANTRRPMKINPEALRRLGIDPDAPLGPHRRWA